MSEPGACNVRCQTLENHGACRIPAGSQPISETREETRDYGRTHRCSIARS